MYLPTLLEFPKELYQLKLLATSETHLGEAQFIIAKKLEVDGGQMQYAVKVDYYGH